MVRLVGSLSIITVSAATVEDDPTWGCGLLGFLPGINSDGSKSSEMQRLIDGIKGASSYGKPSYWNWGLAPDGKQPLSDDFIFMPENWGAGVVKLSELQEAGLAGVKDQSGATTPATMAEILLGTNEPDIAGICEGSLGTCSGACTGSEIDAGVCPIADSDNPVKANAVGHCDCWSKSTASSAGFWSFYGCSDPQPLPDMWSDAVCAKSVMDEWKVTAVDVAAQKGYRFLSTPLMAFNMTWLRSFVEYACKDCSDVSCGCPTHLGWHMYSYDCRPESLGGYSDFQRKLDASQAIMEDFPQIKGVIINEVGMLDGCNADDCVPQYPAKDQPGHTCPSTDEMPNGLGGYLEKLLDMASKAKTKDGRRVVKGFSWFNEDQVGGSYDIRIADETGKLSAIGESYIRGCQAWASSLSESVVV